MTITANKFASKAAVAFVAVAMIFTMFAPSAKAQSSEDLQAMINTLLAQIAALQAQSGTGAQTAVGTSSVCPFTWTRDLNNGATGADVMKLQQFLNSNADTRVSASGAGSVGAETSYYGPATAAAVSKMQVMYRAEILTPGGLVNPTGFFGPSSRAKANALCVTAPAVVVVPGTGTVPGTVPGTTVTLKGEASLDSFEIDDMSDDEAEEGELKEIGTFTVEFTDGDASISRLDIALLEDGETSTNGAGVGQPWRAFETVSLWVDGDMVAEINADDKDDYLDEDDGSLRFTGLDIVAMEDEELEITIGVTVQNGLDNDELATWELFALSTRYFDAVGVATTEESLGDLTGNEDAGVGVTAKFTTVAEGANDDASIESSSKNPDSTTLKVEDDTSDSDEMEIFVFEIELDKDSGDLTLDDMIVDLLVSNPATLETTTVDDVIEEVTLTIRGQSEDGSAVAGTDNFELSHLIAATESNRVAYTFEFDGLELDGDETYEAVLTVVFKGQNVDDYENGVTVQAFVDGSEAQLEGSEGSNVLTDTEQSEIHTLATVVPIVTGVKSSITQANNVSNSGSIIFEFKVEADGDDVDVTVALLNAATALTSSAATPLAKPAPSLSKISGDATGGPANYVVEDGDDATFRLTYTFTTLDADSNGNYTINLDNVSGIEVDETSPALPLAH